MKILICDDQQILMSAIELRLQKNGFSLIRAAHGQDALDKVDLLTPDFLVVDVHTPQLSGIKVLQYIRKVLNSDLPVILIGTIEDEAALLEACRLGANDFLIKPFKPLELIIRIKKILEQNPSIITHAQSID